MRYLATSVAALALLVPLSVHAEDAAPLEDDPCATYKHGRSHHRLRGRLSLGFAKSHVDLEDETEGKQKSLIARLHGRRGLAIEFELSRLSLDAGDTARTAGASLVKTFGRRKLAPYVIAGGGGGRYDHAAGAEQRMSFGEIGGGLMVRGKRFSIGIDMRRGVRNLAATADSTMALARATTTPSGNEDHLHYVRGRILALLNF